ncbi:MAG TPA: glycosyl transferase [Ignisphaera sp.]|nr:glycosyl transferase [Ignisphaera sp.]
MISRACLAILLFLVIINVYLTTSQALHFEALEVAKMESGAKGYVSDEVWYVNAARNILRKIFGLIPRMDIPRATLVYNNSIEVVKAEALATAYNVKVLSSSFTKINALYVEAKSRNAIEQFAKATNATDIVYGWILGDAENINNYLNLEHPPMAKYLIALAMVVFGDRPFFWRIPSIVMGALLVVLTFLLVYEISRSEELSLITTAFIAADPMVKNLASIALLDIHVATLTVLAIVLALRKKFKESVLMISFASTFKFTALIGFFPLIFLVIKNIAKKTKRFIDVFFEVLYYTLLLVVAFILFQLLVSIPIVLSIGVGNWVRDSILGAISWHLSVKCVGTECPPASAPWDWFFGINAFPFYIEDGRTTSAAIGFVPAYTACFLLMILSIPYMAIMKSKSRTAWYGVLGLFLGYVILWLAGSRTQYSFYAVQLTPFIYTYLVIQVRELIDRSTLLKVFTSWYVVLSNLWGSVLKFFEE